MDLLSEYYKMESELPMSYIRLMFALYFGVTTVVCAAQEVPQPMASAALVCLLEGSATVTKPGARSRDLALYDWLPEGSQVRTMKGARLILVFSTGERWELSGKALAKIGKSGLMKEQGDIRELERVPMIPSMAKVNTTHEGRPGAFIVRNEETGVFRSLYPTDGAKVLANAAELRFQSTLKGAKFRIEVEDESGKPVHFTETLESKVIIPSSILRSSSKYYWSVKCLDCKSSILSAKQAFETIPEDEAQIREQLKSMVDKKSDPCLKNLLAEMDRWLGLK